MTKYKCGHNPDLTIMESGALAISTWLTWKDDVGFDGDKSECFECYCKRTAIPQKQNEVDKHD